MSCRYYASDPEHTVARLLRRRGWEATASPGEATVVLPARGEALPRALRGGHWAWCNGFLPLAYQVCDILCHDTRQRYCLPCSR